MHTIAIRWLRKMNFRIPAQHFGNELRHHPDYPSLAALTDTLDAAGFPNIALQVNKDKAQNIPLPFLAQVTVQREPGLVLISDKKQLSDTSFLNSWDGISIVADRVKDFSLTPSYQQKLISEQVNRWKLAFAVLFPVLLLAARIADNFSLPRLFLITSSLAGIGVAILLRMHTMGISNSFTENLCASGPDTDCDAVINSKGSRLPFAIEWMDIGFIYFTAMFICTWMNEWAPVLAIIAMLSIPFTIFSVVYQRFVAKKWCPLCMGTVGILWIQAISLWGSLQLTVPPLNDVLFTLTIFAAVTAPYFYIKPQVLKIYQLQQQAENNKRLRLDPVVFTALMSTQRRVDTKPLQHEVQLANGNADIQFTVACNPYCNPCAKAHSVLDELVQEYGDHIGLSVRFIANENNMADGRTIATTYIFSIIEQETAGRDKPGVTRKILHDWFTTMDLQKFQRVYSLTRDFNSTAALIEHARWGKQSQITNTPTIFINGRELPKQYAVNDLPALVNQLLNIKRK